MKRILIVVAVFVFVALAAVPVAAQDKPFTLIYESVYPKGHMRFLVVEEMLDRIEAGSKGRIKFDKSRW